MSDSLRDAFETAHNCCGYKSTSDRTSCPESRAATAVSCSTNLSGRQAQLLNWLAISLFSFAVLMFINYLVAYVLIKRYAKARKQFKQQEYERGKGKQASSSSKKIEKYMFILYILNIYIYMFVSFQP